MGSNKQKQGAGLGACAPRKFESDLRDLDERFESLLRLSTDFYWETDPQHRFTRFYRGSNAISALPQSGLIGKTRWELAHTRPDEAGWRAHRERLDRHLPFRDFEFARLTPAGEERHFRISGEPMFAADGSFLGYRGVGQDVTELKRTEAGLRQSEARFYSLAELSADWYWEQDEQFRFSFISSSYQAKTGQDPAQLLGRTSWDKPALNLTEEDWTRHRAHIERHEPYFEFEIRRAADRGHTRWLSISGEPVFGQDGRFCGYRGVSRDITRRKRAQQLLELEHGVARCLADADNAAEALKAVIRAVCESENWECGRYFWADDQAGVLRFGEHWGVAGGAIEKFIEDSRSLVYPLGAGLAGRVWQTGEPLWSDDTTGDPRVLMSALAQESGIHGAFVFPVTSEGKTIGILAFNTREIREPDEGLLKAVRVIGSQIGQFLKRMHAEEEQLKSEQRFRSLTMLTSDTYWEQDEQYRFTLFTGTGKEWIDGVRRNAIGKTRWEMGFLNMSAADWAAHIAACEAHQPYYDLELYMLADRKKLWVSVSGEPIYDESGAFKGYRGVGKDITDRMLAEEELRASEARFRAVFEQAGVGVGLVAASDGRWLRVNQKLCDIVGRAQEEMLAHKFVDITHPEDREAHVVHQRRAETGEIQGFTFEKRFLHKEGAIVWVSISFSLVRDEAGDPDYYISIYEDITERKRAQEATHESEERFRLTFELAGSGIAHVALDGRFLRANRSLCTILGYSAEELAERTVKDISHPDDRDITDVQRARMRSGELESARFQKRYLRKDGATVWVHLTVALVRDANGVPLYEIAVFDDETERKQAELALRESEERFRSLTALSSDWYWEQDEQFRFTVVSGGIQAGFGISPEAVLGKTRWDVAAVGMTDEDWATHKAVLEAHQPFRDFEYARLDAQGRVRHRGVSGEPMFDEHGRFAGYRGVGRDITERKTAQAKLKQAYDDLARSNAELEQFAYVASHDLQEPLRMVSSYTQLLARRYGERLDGDAREFMDFIVDGAARMKRLIEDLLAYSRVGTRGKEFRPVAGEQVLARARNNLKAAIEASGAVVTHDPLPELEADDFQLVQLLQNLIGNALKFHRAEAPRVHVSAAERGDDWEIAVRDNGIGIEPQYFQRIFLMFQRLHDRGEYPGTGIGLAICKKVVDRHGGRIWVESLPGEGSTFRFTLPKQRGGSHV